MNQKLNTIIILGVIAGLLTIIVMGSNKKTNQSVIGDNEPVGINQNGNDRIIDSKLDENEEGFFDEDIFYWGTTCPYCHDVMDWIDDNGVDEKLNIIQKEVYGNRVNANELSAKARECGLASNNIGVPFMYTSDRQCLIGYPDIVSYLENKVMISENQGNKDRSTESSGTGERK